jgi:hypothetical protein
VDSARETPREVAERLDQAFARRDGQAMSECYAERCEFSDPVFVDLEGDEVGAMWRMLSARARGFSLTYRVVSTDERTARIEWQADYLFSATGRQVHNEVKTEIELEGGLIVRQRDAFDLHRWAAMALGWKGRLLGGTGFLQGAIRKQARRGLAEWMAREYDARPAARS